MASVAFNDFDWWQAVEIPLAEEAWPNIKLYFDHRVDKPFELERCLYFIRLSPPYSIYYHSSDERYLESPLLYVGTGSIKQRWGAHRAWMAPLGEQILGGRYEVWVCAPRSKKNADFYKDLEAGILTEFKRRCGYLPLRNLKIQNTPRNHIYEEDFFERIVRTDRRYKWAMYPMANAKPVHDWYYKQSE